MPPPPPSSPAQDPCTTDNVAPKEGGAAAQHIGVPDGGARAWLVVAGGFINFMVAFGLLNSFGTFQAFYQEKFADRGTAAIAWIGSIQLFILFLGGIVIGSAFDKLGSRGLMELGTVFCLVSFLCTSLSTEYWQYLVAQGVLFGIGNAMLFYPAMGAIAEWFDKRRGLALGVALSGSSAGGIVWPLVINKLLLTVPEGQLHQVIAVVATPLLLLSCVLVRERRGVAGHNTRGDAADVSQRGRASAVLERRFLALSGCLTILYCGMLIPYYYIPLFAQEHGFGATMSNKLLAVAYAGSFVSRIGAGWLSDRFGRFNVLVLVATLMSVVMACWIWVTSLGAMLAFVALFGLFSGALVPLGSACVAQTTPDMGHMGLRIGVMMAISSAGALAGGPVSGLIKDSTAHWVGVASFSACVALLGALLLMLVRLWHQPRWFASF